MKPVLWYLPGAASLAVHVVLEEIGLPYTLRRVAVDGDGNREAALWAVNPDGRVPVLELDGVAMTESAAICLVLAERDPERRLLPPLGSVAYAEAIRSLVFLTNTVQETILRALYPARYVSDEAAAGAVQEAAAERLDVLFDRIDATLTRSPYLAGEEFTVADPYLFMLTRWGRRLARPAWDRPGIRAHWLRLAARPAVGRVLAEEDLPERPPG